MAVDWQCKKPTAVALSTAEAEFVAASIGGQDVLGLNELFKEIGLSVMLPIEMKMDNQAADQRGELVERQTHRYND